MASKATAYLSDSTTAYDGRSIAWHSRNLFSKAQAADEAIVEAARVLTAAQAGYTAGYWAGYVDRPSQYGPQDLAGRMGAALAESLSAILPVLDELEAEARQ